jgi:hypothetical protein
MSAARGTPSTQSISPVGPHSQRNMPAGRSCGGWADGSGEGNELDFAGGCGSREAVTAGGSSRATAGRSGRRSGDATARTAAQPSGGMSTAVTSAAATEAPFAANKATSSAGMRGLAMALAVAASTGGTLPPSALQLATMLDREARHSPRHCREREFDQLSPLDRRPWASTAAGQERSPVVVEPQDQAFREQKVTTSGMGSS